MKWLQTGTARSPPYGRGASVPVIAGSQWEPVIGPVDTNDHDHFRFYWLPILLAPTTGGASNIWEPVDCL